MEPLRWAVHGKHRFNCSGSAEDRWEWALAQKRWCCKTRAAACNAEAHVNSSAKSNLSMLSTTSSSDFAASARAPHMDCKGQQSQEFRDWCCSHQDQDMMDDCRHGGDSLAAVPALSVGLPPPPRPSGPGGSAAEAGAGGEGQAWPVPGDMAKAKLGGCDTLCEYHGQASTCRFRIQWAATHDFLWRLGACRQSYEAVLLACPSCSSCALAGSGCVTPAPTTQKPPTTASMAGGAVGASHW